MTDGITEALDVLGTAKGQSVAALVAEMSPPLVPSRICDALIEYTASALGISDWRDDRQSSRSHWIPALGSPAARALRWAAVLYGIGLALTFDEFGLWVHLGGSYWQRASFDAVVVIAALLGLVAVAPALPRFRPHHWATAAMLAGAVTVFGYLLVDSLQYADRLLLRIQIVEQSQPPLR